MGGDYAWIVLITAAAVIIYFAFVFGRIARIKAKLTKAELNLDMQAGKSSRFTGSE
jgi:hypothetical protein